MKFLGFFLILPVIALGGCVTLDGLKQDIVQGYDSVSGKIAKLVDPVKEAKKQLPVYDGTCPNVSIRPDLTHLAEFYDDSKPSAATMSSEITMTGVQNTCRIENDALVMQVDITLEGKTGPKARIKPKDQPNFAYPYFVAVTDAQGNVLSKEIFAASVAYGREQNSIKQTESIFQNMPFPDAASGQVYNVVIGFQLTEQQLAYNGKTPASDKTYNHN